MDVQIEEFLLINCGTVRTSQCKVQDSHMTGSDLNFVVGVEMMVDDSLCQLKRKF